MSHPPSKAPHSICLLRLSALGDVMHMVPIVRTLQAAWPDCQITWVIGKLEAELVKNLEGVRLVVFDKSQGWRAYLGLRRALKGEHFDFLLHMQAALRASLVRLMIHSDLCLGFDRARGKDLQWLFTNQQIPAHPGQHVLDSFFSFLQSLGVQDKQLRWDLPIDPAAQMYAKNQLGDQRTLIINPAASFTYRNWFADRYAAVADYAFTRYGLKAVLTGGATEIEKHLGRDIEAATSYPVTNLIGATSLQELLALIFQADLVIAPDTGPAHMATAVGTPVIGLYATTNPLRAAPYLNQRDVASAYETAVLNAYGKPSDQLSWGTRVRDQQAMKLITVEQVKQQLDAVMARLS